MKKYNFETKTKTAKRKVNFEHNEEVFRAHRLGFVAILLTLVIMAFMGTTDVHAEDANTTFQVNVKETLSVQITTPTTWASGDVNEFLRNKVSLNVSTNNANGFTASMYSQTTTNLTNTSINTETIPTLASSAVRGSFPANYWGYSLGVASFDNKTYGETDAGDNTSSYYPLVNTSATPIKILTGTSNGSRDIYFGAKAGLAKASGTYTGTVVINVVTDTIDSNTNPMTPTNPATPSSTEETAAFTAAPVGSTSHGSTVYTYTRTNSTNHTTTTTTQVSDGNNVSAYSGYTPPQGVSESTDYNVSSAGSPVAAGLATTASVAAASGILFFILAKRREKDDEEDESEM